jgi:hypothetical protein
MVNQPPPAFEPYQPASSPLEKASSTPEWTPPPAPEANWQNQPVGQDSPFQPPPAGVAVGQNKTLAIVSLVLGILSLLCCSWFIPGIAAIVTGVMARGKAKKNPAQYGGEGLALGGIITGVISLILGAIVAVLYLGGMFASMGLNY